MNDFNVSPRSAVNTGLFITIIVVAMLLPVILIAWASKKIYNPRHSRRK